MSKMKTIGLIGGMSWESTTEYYRYINESIKEHLGGLHSANIILASVDFGPMEQMMHQDDWQGIGEILCKAARNIQKAGADFFLICTNTMHKLAAEVEAAAGIPLVHIADSTAEQLLSRNIQCAGLLGTSFTMEQDFYSTRLMQQFGLDILVPDADDRALVNTVIFDELCQGRTEPESRSQYLRIISKLENQGAQGIILGCTEIGMLVKQQDTTAQLFDTTHIHAQAAVKFALSD